MAQVQVACLSACDECSAHSLCIGPTRKKGVLAVKNPLRAEPGDDVVIEIPEGRYNRALILIFGGLLAAALAGTGLGWLVATGAGLPSSLTLPLGFFLGLASAAAGQFRYFRKANEAQLYPRIIDIANKGEDHG